MAKKVQDRFANVAAINVIEPAAGTPGYEKFNFPYSILDKMGLLISRIEYWFGSLPQLNSGGDNIIAGLTAQSPVVSLTNQSDPSIIDTARLLRLDYGAAASAELHFQPTLKDFSNLPGGGILVAPAPLYGAVVSTGAGGAMSCWIRLYYTYMELSTEDYWQLVESRRIISS